LRVGIDIGGAFTDLVAYEPDTGETAWVKAETTPAEFSEGVRNCVAKSGLEMRAVDMIIHGQTLVINTIVTPAGAKVGLITTRGFRDVLELQRSNRRDIYNFRYRKPEALVPRHLRLEVDERVLSEGDVLRSLDRGDIKKAAEALVAEGVEAIAISLINSYANPSHEEEAAKMVRHAAPDCFLTLASEVTREWGEYERTSTAVLNAYTMPKLTKYLDILEGDFRENGFAGTPLTMLSSGGMAPFDHARRYPITTMESGPIAGVIGSIAVAEVLGLRNILTLDGGSTTTKASLVQDLSPTISTEHYVERDEYNPGYPVFVPTVEVVEVGNGGTSIAWIDSIGNVRVGPRAAGAYPGPACYGKGGTEPTVTDAYVVTGLLNPRYLLGGDLRIDRSLSEKALRPLAERYSTSVEAFAEGAVRLANDNAAYAIRLVSVQRGHDPRDFALIAYGGSGPMFAPFIAEELEIGTIVVPSVPPGVFSAWGMLVTDIKHDLVLTRTLRLDVDENLETMNETYRELQARMAKIFQQEGLKSEGMVFVRSADMRYHGQEHTVRVDVMAGTIGEAELEELVKRFHEAHERKYAFKLEGSPVEIVNFHVSGILRMGKASLPEVKAVRGSAREALLEEREVYLDGRAASWPVYDRTLLPVGSKLAGPLIIEEPTCTTIALEGQSARVDEYGNVIIRRR
jgi:N-methylhydantoinase A